MRDMTKRQFAEACKRHGFAPGLWGYYELGDTGVLVYARNGGDTRRAQLAYMIHEHEKKTHE